VDIFMQLIAGLCAAVLVADNMMTDRTIEKNYAGEPFFVAKGDPPPPDDGDKKIISRSKPPKHPKPPKDHEPDHNKDDPG
jgi:hypothetical protein